MRIIKARVQNYRSIIDSGYFDIEEIKTILVGPNEAGKTAILQALQKLNPPDSVAKFDALRDYPRSLYNDISIGKVKVEDVVVVEGHFKLDQLDKDALPDGFKDITYVFKRKLDNQALHYMIGGPSLPTYAAITKDLKRLSAHVDAIAQSKGVLSDQLPSVTLQNAVSGLNDQDVLSKKNTEKLKVWIEKVYPYIEENNSEEDQRYDKLMASIQIGLDADLTLDICFKRLPILILFNNFFRVKPLIHLEHLANRVEGNILDDEQYDYGNLCLLKLLGFNARELSNLGKPRDPQENNASALQKYRDQLDKRTYQLNAASVRLTAEIKSVWNPNPDKVEANKLRVQADGQYLKVVVEDDLGVDIELDQRSEGFQWLVSFFIVFFAEAVDKHENAILLLDEPGLSLHGLKQREFRATITRLAEKNQTLFSTHSPFLVGPNELECVRVVEMINRETGTKVHTTISAGDSAAMLPLQEALGYDLAQSLFMQQKNLVLEGLTDYWYIATLAELLKEAGIIEMDPKIALIPASTASKVVYFATILHSNKLKVVALLDSDNAGDQAAKQDTLVGTLGNKNILRTKDFYKGSIDKPEIEDLIRTTLVSVAKSKLSWDVEALSLSQPNRPIIDIFSDQISGFSKYRLSKAFMAWSHDNSADKLSPDEVEQGRLLIEKINKCFK